MQEENHRLPYLYLDLLAKSYAAKSLKIPLSRDDRFEVFQVLSRERKVAQGELRGERTLLPTPVSDGFSDTIFREVHREAGVLEFLRRVKRVSEAVFYVHTCSASCSHRLHDPVVLSISAARGWLPALFYPGADG